MAHELLHELCNDVRRLLPAGTTAIAGDRGLQQREKALQALGTKVPALVAVAETVVRVRQAPPSKAAAPLCDLLLLTRQLAASLVSAGCEGTATAIEKSGPWQTAAALRDVTTWAAGSYTAYANDFKELQGAIQRPDFADLRLIEPLLNKLNAALGDEETDLLGDLALPAFGAALLPDLRRDLNPHGGMAHARRLRAVCIIDPRQGVTLCRQALADGGPHVKAQALYQLTRLAPADGERAALEVLGQKAASRLAETALRALATSQKDAALDSLFRGLLSTDFNLEFAAKDALATQPHPHTTARLLEILEGLRTAETEAAARARKPAAKGKGKSAKQTGPTADDIREHMRRVVHVLGERKDAAAVPALVALLDQKNAELREAAIDALANLGDMAGLRAAADHMDDSKVEESAARAAWLLPTKERYERLAPWVAELAKPKKSEHRRAKIVLELFDDEFTESEEDFFDLEPWETRPEPRPRRTDWDPRWVPLLRKHLNGPYRAEVALGLAAVLGEKAVPELLPLLAPSVKKDECGVVEALGYLRAKVAVPLLVPLMPGQPWHHYCIHDALRRINDPAAIPLLEGLLEKIKERDRHNNIVAVIEYLEKHRTEG
jgi:HEAT repeat protein